jgi:hypothetical protein
MLSGARIVPHARAREWLSQCCCITGKSAGAEAAPALVAYATGTRAGLLALGEF